MHRIEAASTAIVQNYADYYVRQSTQNLAHAGVNMSLRQLAWNRKWMAGIGTPNYPLSLLGGRCYTKIDTGIAFRGLSTIRVTSVGISQYGTELERRDTTVCYAYFPPSSVPPGAKGVVTLNSSNAIVGDITLDGRDHDAFSTSVKAGQGTYGVWTTGSTFATGGFGGIGGTNTSGVDFVPPMSGVADSSIIALNQAFSPAYPGTPDSILGGTSAGYPEGTLKNIAKSGVGGSQYVRYPWKLRYPLRGVTYVELSSGGVWNWAYLGNSGTGILVVHNSTRNATIRDVGGNFSGIILADDIVQFHANVWGTIIGLTPAPTGTMFGTSACSVYYSRQAILDATAVLANGTHPNIAGWFE